MSELTRYDVWIKFKELGLVHEITNIKTLKMATSMAREFHRPYRIDKVVSQTKVVISTLGILFALLTPIVALAQNRFAERAIEMLEAVTREHNGVEITSLANQPNRVVQWDVSTFNRLMVLTSGNQNEVIICVGGIDIGDSLVITDPAKFFIPLHLISTPSNARARKCPEGTVINYHNHPRWDDDGALREETMDELCNLSKLDINTAVKHTEPVVAIGVSDGQQFMVCAWRVERLPNEEEEND